MKSREDSQVSMVRQWLMKGNSITPLEALTRFGAFRLSHIIYVLKRKFDMNIKTEMVVENDKRYAKYYLSKEC